MGPSKIQQLYFFSYEFLKFHHSLFVYSVAYFSLDWVEICTEHPRNHKDNMQDVFM